MNKLGIFPDELAKNALIPLREKLDLEARKRNLKIPPHLDLTVDCVLIAHFLTWAHNLFVDKNYKNDYFENSVVNHIYNKNIDKIASQNISDSDYSFQIERHIPDFRTRFSNLTLQINKSFAHAVILDTIKNTQKEIVNVLKSKENNEKFIPNRFFFDCFIHPSVLTNLQNILPIYENRINVYASEICELLIIETRQYLQELSNGMKKELDKYNADYEKKNGQS